MRKVVTLIVALCFVSGYVSAETAITAKYFMATAKRLGNDMYYQVDYTKWINDRLGVQAGVGYAKLEATDMSNTREESLTYIPFLGDIVIKLADWFRVKGGISYNSFDLSSGNVKDTIGFNAGLELGKEWSLDITHSWGDMEVRAPLLEDGTNIMGWALGIRRRF